jgi:hypothetical protein
LEEEEDDDDEYYVDDDEEEEEWRKKLPSAFLNPNNRQVNCGRFSQYW